jgi:hypothetical protein
MLLSLTACGGTSRDSGHQVPDDGCIDLPEHVRALADRTLSREEVTSGCRETGAAGCDECCVPAQDLTGQEKCLVLTAKGEELASGPCDGSCEPCARCTVEAEGTLLAYPADSCRCESPRSSLGFDPSVPCDQQCYSLEVAARSCPHLVCSR